MVIIFLVNLRQFGTYYGPIIDNTITLVEPLEDQSWNLNLVLFDCLMHRHNYFENNKIRFNSDLRGKSPSQVKVKVMTLTFLEI